jgi:phosphotriesterase-related protein
MDYMLAVAERGAYLSFDSFGDNWYMGTRVFMDDGTRVTHLLKLVERGHLHQLLLSSDICTKIQITRFGGFGYAHISRFVEPILRDHGLSVEAFRTMRVDNPRRLLTVPD